MNIKTFIILCIFSLTSCKNEKSLNNEAKQSDKHSIKIREYIQENIDNTINPRRNPRFEVIDSVKLIGLNSILYKVDDRGTIDDNDYFLIQDCGNNEIQSITNRHWPSFNSETNRDLQIQILTNDESGKKIELINYDYLGLEMYLNRSSELKKRLITDMELDTMIRFMGDKELMRITKIEEIDTLISKIDRQYDKEQERYEYEHFLKVRPILEKKIKEKNVLLYRLYWNSLLEYFEVLPYISTSVCQDKKGKEREECEKFVSENYKSVVKGGFYNLKIMRIR
jgi:hypothetical protein